MDKLLILKLAPVILTLLFSFVGLVVGAYFNQRTLTETDRMLASVAKELLNTNQYEPDSSKRKEIEDLRRQYHIHRRQNILQICISLVSGIAAILAAYIFWKGADGKLGQVIHLLPFAYAQSRSVAPAPVPVQPPAFLGVMLTAILLVLLLVFLCAVIASLVLKDVPENVSRRTAANDIVKTFGGFFIGVLTSFLKQAIGS